MLLEGKSIVITPQYLCFCSVKALSSPFDSIDITFLFDFSSHSLLSSLRSSTYKEANAPHHDFPPIASAQFFTFHSSLFTFHSEQKMYERNPLVTTLLVPIMPVGLAVLATALLALTSCHSSKVATLEVIRHDTVQTAIWHYDSVYIDRFVKQDLRHDTILLTDHKTEYRYKVIRDTLHTVRTDSVPYPVRVVETRTLHKVPPWMYLLVGALSVMLSGGFVVWWFRDSQTKQPNN